MSLTVDREECRSEIELRLREDPFLGLRDQLPLVSSLRDRLEREFQELLTSLQERISRQKKDFESALDAIRDYFGDNLSRIVAEFDKAEEGADPAVLRGLSRMFRRSISVLYNPVQRQLKPCLKDLSPSSTVLPGYLSEVERLYRRQAGDWPELAALIYEKATDTSLQGRSILEANLAEAADQCCRSRLGLINRIRRFFLQQRFRFRYRILRVPLNQAFTDIFLAGGVRRDRLLLSRWGDTVAGLEAKLEDSWQVVRYNLEVASTELDSKAADPPADKESFLESLREAKQIVSETFTAGHASLSEIRGPYEDFLDFLLVRIEHHHREGVETLDSDLRLMGGLKGFIYWGLKRLRKLQQTFLKRTAARIGRIFRVFRVYFIKAYYLVEDLLSDLTKWLGFSREVREFQLALTELPRRESIESKLGGLPPVYRRLFSNEPLLNREFLVGRERTLKELREALDRWSEGKTTSTVLVGQVGTGKTSLVNCFVSDLESDVSFAVRSIDRRLRSEADVVELFREWFAIGEPISSTSELVQRLKALPRQGVIVESCHNLMLRSIGGRRAAETFFSLVLSTREDIFWLVTSREWPWRMLDHQISSRLYFTHEITTRFHRAEDLEMVVLRRHRCSGYQLLFLPEGVNDRRLRKLLMSRDVEAGPVQELLKKNYFAHLYGITSGNIVAAIYFWLTSLDFDANSRTMKVRPCPVPDLGLIQTLDAVSLYSLAELLNHAYLSEQEHSEIFQLSASQSRTTLDYLFNVRLVEQFESEGKALYSINTVLLNPMCDVLKKMNVFY